MPYPEKFGKKENIRQILTRGDDTFRSIEEIIPSPNIDVESAGRIVLYRSFGKIAFAHLHIELNGQ